MHAEKAYSRNSTSSGLTTTKAARPMCWCAPTFSSWYRSQIHMAARLLSLDFGRRLLLRCIFRSSPQAFWRIVILIPSSQHGRFRYLVLHGPRRTSRILYPTACLVPGSGGYFSTAQAATCVPTSTAPLFLQLGARQSSYRWPEFQSARRWNCTHHDHQHGRVEIGFAEFMKISPGFSPRVFFEMELNTFTKVCKKKKISRVQRNQCNNF